MKPQIIAHRGWSGRYPENTILAFEKALELPVNGLEFDLRRTADGEIVLSHEPDVNMHSNGTGLIKDLTLKELKKLDFGIKKNEMFAGTRIPEFNEFLDAVIAKRPDVWLAVELKEDDEELARRAFKALEERNLFGQCSIISFKSNMLRAAKKYVPELPRHGFSTLNLPDEGDDPEYLSLLNRVGININSLNLKIAEFYHSRGVKIDTWAPGTPAQYAVARACQIDFVTTNDPDIILDLQSKKSYLD